jgi:hypothetical protein
VVSANRPVQAGRDHNLDGTEGRTVTQKP